MDNALRILVVDDNPDHALLQKVALEGALKAEVQIAASGAACLKRLSQGQRFELVLLDYSLPGEDGLELLKAIQKDGEETPVIMVTGQGDERVAVEAMKQGAYDYVTKSGDYLLTLPLVVEKALERHRLLLQQRRIQEDIRRTNDELAALNAVITAVNTSLELEEILDIALAKVVELFGGDSGRVLLTSGQFREIGRSVQEGRGEVLPVGRHPGEYQTLLSVPIQAKGKVLGSLEVRSSREDAFSLRDRFLLSAIGEGLGIAIEKAQLHRTISDSERKYRNLVENTNDLVWQATLGGDITYINRDIAGFPRQEIEEGGTAVMMQLHTEESWKNFSAAIQRVVQEKKGVAALETTHLNQTTGNMEYYLTSIFPIFTDAGRVMGIQGISKDITEIKRAEQRILRMEKLWALGQMASGVAHDFNNILTSILGRAQVALRQAGSHELKTHLAAIEQAARQGVEVVRRIQDFSRVRKGLGRSAAVNINQVVQEALEITQPRWRSQAARQGLQIDVVTKLGELPLIVGDKAELTQALINLILNAVEAMPTGGAITLQTQSMRDHIYIKVQDTGIGIPKDIQGKIFDPFFTTKGCESIGLGLGLSLSYSIIHRHKGEISVTSQEGQGSTFTIRLPVLRGGQPPHKAMVAEARPKPATILVVDDEEGVREILAHILRDEGHRVRLTSSSQEALRVFAEGHFDLVFADLGMSGISGREVVRGIKELSPQTPVIMITGWKEVLPPQEQEQLSIDGVVAKPFQIEEIRKLVACALDKSSQRARAS